MSDATGDPSENSLSQFTSNGKRRTSAAAAENGTLFFIQYYTRTTLDSRRRRSFVLHVHLRSKATGGGTKMEWKNNNPGRLSGAPLRPSREKTQSAETASSPARAARARARPASFRMSLVYIRGAAFLSATPRRAWKRPSPPPRTAGRPNLSPSRCANASNASVTRASRPARTARAPLKGAARKTTPVVCAPRKPRTPRRRRRRARRRRAAGCSALRSDGGRVKASGTAYAKYRRRARGATPGRSRRSRRRRASST